MAPELDSVPHVGTASRHSRRPRVGAAACALAVVCGLAAGCSRTAPAGAAEVRLRIGVGLGATGRTRALTLLTTYLFADSVVSLGWDGRPVAGLADEWRWEEDGKTLFLHIRPGLKFHDGRPVTASTIVGMLREQLDAARDDPNSPGWQYVQGIDAPDETSLVIRLSRPDAFLLSELNETLIFDRKTPDIGTGPFRIVSRGDSVQTQKNPDYYRGAPAIDRVEIIPYDTQRGAWAAMMRGEVDMVPEVARESVDFLEGASSVQTYSSVRPHYIALVFNLRHPILSRVEVRRALNVGIDREQIVTKAMRGHATVADDPIWPFHWAYSAAVRRYTYNPDAARLRLDAAGFPLPKARPSAERMTARFRLTCLFWNEDPEFERIALLLQRQLSEVGVDLGTAGRRAEGAG